MTLCRKEYDIINIIYFNIIVYDLYRKIKILEKNINLRFIIIDELATCASTIFNLVQMLI